MKILTVSIFAYNMENYIQQCLDSFTDERLNGSLEVLIINDGSTDSTAQIAEQYVQQFPAIFRLINKENGGHGSTINRGIQEAGGKYYKPVNGGDYLDTGNLVKIIDRLKEVDADVVITDYCEWYQKKNRIKRISTDIHTHNTVQPFYLNNDILVFHQLTYRTSLFKENNIKVLEKVFFEDTEFTLNPIEFVSTMIYFPVLLYYYRLEREGQSVSNETFLKHETDIRKVLVNSFIFYQTRKKQSSKEKKLYYKNRIYRALDFYHRTLKQNSRIGIFHILFYLQLCFLSPYLFLLFFCKQKSPLIYKLLRRIKNEVLIKKYKSYSSNTLQKIQSSLLSEADNSRRILIVSQIPSHPVREGSRALIVAYSNLLKDLGYSVYFLWIAQDRLPDNGEYSATMNYWGDKFLFYPKKITNAILDKIYGIDFSKDGYTRLDIKYPIGIGSFLKKVQKYKKFDTVIINYAVFSKIFMHFKNARKILFTHDAFTNKNQRTGSKWYSLRVEDEERGLNRADVILSVQEYETLFFNFLTTKKILTTYACFPIHQTPLADIRNNTHGILFLSGDNIHNIEGFTFFYKEIFNELKKVYSDIKLIIGGTIGMHNKIKDLVVDDANIELQGMISDLYHFYSQADICINPVFNGTGIKMKTFEALSYGKILITHPHSLVGVYDSVNVPVMLASNKTEYLEQFNRAFSPDFNRSDYKHSVIDYMIRFQNHVRLQFIEAVGTV